MCAMGDWNARIGRTGDRGGYTWNDLEEASSICECFCLFSASSEEKRIPTLQSYSDLAGSRLLDEQSVDFFLRPSMRSSLLPDIDFLRGIRCPFEQERIAQIIVNHHFGPLQAGTTLDGEESRIARPGSNEITKAGFHAGGKVRRINLPSSIVALAAMAT